MAHQPKSPGCSETHESSVRHTSGFLHDAVIGGNLGMRKALVFTVAVTLVADAQRIDTQKADSQKVVRVSTALNHLSVIELAEPVVEVAAGSSSYKIEWRENKVFVQPLDQGATTNLFIWTASGRQATSWCPRNPFRTCSLRSTRSRDRTR